LNRYSSMDLGIVDEIVDLVHQKGGVYLDEFLFLPLWKKFCDLSSTFKSTHEILIDQPVPKDWPNLQCGTLIVTNESLHRNVEKYENYLRQNSYHDHGANELDFKFYINYDCFQYEKERLFRAIESFGLNNQSIFCRPSSDHEMIPIFSIQDTTPQIETHSMARQDFNTAKIDIRKCQCIVILEDYCFNDNYSGGLSKEFFQAIASGIPWIVAGNFHQREIIKKLGFCYHLESAKNQKELIYQMLWLKTIFENQKMSRRWQNEQGKLIAHNQKILKTLKKQKKTI